MGQKTVAENRKARHDYFILESLEAGIALTGTEVKSMRAGRVNLKDSYIFIQNNEAFIEALAIMDRNDQTSHHTAFGLLPGFKKSLLVGQYVNSFLRHEF